MYFFVIKQKTAYEMRISYWSSDVCSSDLMRALLGAQMLAPHLPSVRHRDRAVERRPAPPRRRRRVRALTLERIFDADHAGAVRPPPTRGELAADMAEHRRVDILEHAGTAEPGLAAQQLLGAAGPDQTRPRRVPATNPVLPRQPRDDVHRNPAIVPFSIPRLLGRASLT